MCELIEAQVGPGLWQREYPLCDGWCLFALTGVDMVAFHENVAPQVRKEAQWAVFVGMAELGHDSAATARLRQSGLIDSLVSWTDSEFGLMASVDNEDLVRVAKAAQKVLSVQSPDPG
jgi:hypothetical protein